MKKSIAVFAALAAFAFAGCDKLPTAEQMETTATAVGKAAAVVANQTKADAASRKVVVEVMEKAAKATPKVGQTFADAWTPIAKEVTDDLVKDGKLDDAQATIVTAAFSVACKGIDYLVTVRYPKASEYEDLMSAAVRGFTGGFLSSFSAETTAFAAAAKLDYDKEAYDFLLGEAKK